MTNNYALGIDFGTTKSALAFISRSVTDGTPPRLATFLEESGLAPTTADSPFFRPASDVQPVPTAVAVNTEATRSGSPPSPKWDVRTGFSAVDWKQGGSDHRFVVVNDLKDRAGAEGASRTVQVNGDKLPIEGLIAYFLASLRKYATELEHAKLTDNYVTITVPAKSNILQRMTTRFAAAIAGFQGEVSILEEPVAAFLYHLHVSPGNRFEPQQGSPSNVLVVDFGGGTCDMAMIRAESHALPIVVGRAMARLGGRTIDNLIVSQLWLRGNGSNDLENRLDWAADDFDSADIVTKAYLLEYARQAKESVVYNPSSSIEQDISGVLPGVFGRKTAPAVSYDGLVSILEDPSARVLIHHVADGREQESSVKGHFVRLLERLFEETKGESRSIQYVILAGGSSRLPCVQNWITEVIGKKFPLSSPEVINRDPETCVAAGAAVHQLYSRSKKRKWRKAVTPTLSAPYILVHHVDPTTREEAKIELGRENQVLPIVCDNYFKAKPITNIKPRSDGGYAISIRHGDGPSTQWERELKLREGLLATHDFIRRLQALLVYYRINEFGILEKIRLMPGSPFGFQPWKAYSEYGIVEEGEGAMSLRDLALDNTKRINQLRHQFIPEALRL